MSINAKVAKFFDGIDELRDKKQREVAAVKVQTDKYTPAHINEYVESAKQELITDRKERADTAKEAIEQHKQELKKKQYKDPYDDIEAQVIQPEHKLLAEMQFNRKLDLLKAEIAVADSPEDFKKLIEEYGEYEHFDRLINLELKKRGNNLEDGAMFKGLQAELNQDPEEFQELNKLYHTITTLGGLDRHPKGLKQAIENNDYASITYEDLI